jgi:hypothetical protein
MLFDSVLGLPHVDWAGVEHAPAKKKKAAPRRQRRINHVRRHRR